MNYSVFSSRFTQLIRKIARSSVRFHERQIKNDLTFWFITLLRWVIHYNSATLTYKMMALLSSAFFPPQNLYLLIKTLIVWMHVCRRQKSVRLFYKSAKFSTNRRTTQKKMFVQKPKRNMKIRQTRNGTMVYIVVATAMGNSCSMRLLLLLSFTASSMPKRRHSNSWRRCALD